MGINSVFKGLKYVQTSVVWASLEPTESGAVVSVSPWRRKELIKLQGRVVICFEPALSLLMGAYLIYLMVGSDTKERKMSPELGQNFLLIKGIGREENTSDFLVRCAYVFISMNTEYIFFLTNIYQTFSCVISLLLRTCFKKVTLSMELCYLLLLRN